jgi:membrane-associated protease RseP (regulator of RpoE activity)
MLILSLILFTALALIVHELGHLAAARKVDVTASELGLGMGPKICGFRLGTITFNLRLLPLGSFVRLDGTQLAARSVQQQLLVHLGGIIFNLIAAFAARGTMFGWVNLIVAAGNLLPIYKHDGWKCGVVIVRALLQKKSKPVEWVFTSSGCLVSLIILNTVVQMVQRP